MVELRERFEMVGEVAERVGEGHSLRQSCGKVPADRAVSGLVELRAKLGAVLVVARDGRRAGGPGAIEPRRPVLVFGHHVEGQSRPYGRRNAGEIDGVPATNALIQ